MITKIQAVTVSKNYLDDRKWSIKYLTIGTRKNGSHFWHVRITGETGFDKTILQGKAFRGAYENSIPYIDNIRDGEGITLAQELKLKKHGVAAD